MAIAVVTKASGGMPVIDVTATKPGLGVPVTEATNGRGIAVTKVSLAIGGLPVTFVLAGNEWPSGGGTTYATFDGTPSASVVVSNGGLTVTHGSTANATGVKSLTTKSTGKFYFETRIQTTVSNANGAGISTSSGGAFTDPGSTALNGIGLSIGTATTLIYSNNVNTTKNLGATAVNDVFGFAIDMTARLAWVKRNSGLWNNDGAADPVTGVGGVAVPAGSLAPYVRFTNGFATDAVTANFGATAFAGAVPSGFTSGWPV